MGVAEEIEGEILDFFPGMQQLSQQQMFALLEA